MSGLIFALPWGIPGLASGVFSYVAPARSPLHTEVCTKPMREGAIPAILRQETSVDQISELKSELSIRLQTVPHAGQLASSLACSATQPALRLPQKLHRRVKVRPTVNQMTRRPASC